MSDDEDPFAAMESMLNGGGDAAEEEPAEEDDEVADDDDFAALEDLLGGGEPDPEPDPEPDAEPKAEPTPAPEPEKPVPAADDTAKPSSNGPLKAKEAKKGLAVQLLSDPSSKGVIKKKAGKNAQVDFSGSGGDASKWVKLEELQHTTAESAADEADEDSAAEPVGAADSGTGDQAGLLRQEDVQAGMAVRKITAPGEQGVVLKRDGARVRVDFSASGGSKSWLQCSEIEMAEDPEVSSTTAPADNEAPAPADKNHGSPGTAAKVAEAEFAAGDLVELTSEPQARGVVVSVSGLMIKVDMSQSGGKISRFTAPELKKMSKDVVRVKVVRCSNLIGADRGGKSSDPYVVLYLDDAQKQQTSRRDKTLNPEFNEECSFALTPESKELRVICSDFDRVGSDDFIGEVVVDMAELAAQAQARFPPQTFIFGDPSGKLQKAERKQVDKRKAAGDPNPFGTIELEFEFQSASTDSRQVTLTGHEVVVGPTRDYIEYTFQVTGTDAGNETFATRFSHAKYVHNRLFEEGVLDRVADASLDFPDHAADALRDMTHDADNVERRGQELQTYYRELFTKHGAAIGHKEFLALFRNGMSLAKRDVSEAPLESTQVEDTTGGTASTLSDGLGEPQLATLSQDIKSWLGAECASDILDVMENNLVESVGDLAFLANSSRDLYDLGLTEADSERLWTQLEPLVSLARAEVWVGDSREDARAAGEDKAGEPEATLQRQSDSGLDGLYNQFTDQVQEDHTIEEISDEDQSTQQLLQQANEAEQRAQEEAEQLMRLSESVLSSAETHKQAQEADRAREEQRKKDETAAAKKEKQEEHRRAEQEKKDKLAERKREKDERMKQRAAAQKAALEARQKSHEQLPVTKTISRAAAKQSADRLSQRKRPNRQPTKTVGRKSEFIGKEVSITRQGTEVARQSGFGSSVPSPHKPTKGVSRKALKTSKPPRMLSVAAHPKWWDEIGKICPLCKLPEAGAACRSSCGGVGMMAGWVPNGAETPARQSPGRSRNGQLRASPRKSSPRRRRQSPRKERDTQKIHVETAGPAVEQDTLRAAKRKLRSLSYGPKGQDPVKLFGHYDRDNSGALSFEEFKAAVRKGGHLSSAVLSDRDLKQLFAAVDTDGSNDVSIDELTSFVWGASGDDFTGSSVATVGETQSERPAKSSSRTTPRSTSVSNTSKATRTPQTEPPHTASTEVQQVEIVTVPLGGSADTDRSSGEPNATTTVAAEEYEEAVPPALATMAPYYHVVSASANVYDSPASGAKILATLDHGDIIKALKVVSVQASQNIAVPVAAGTMAVQFAGGWVRTLGARGQLTVMPLGELPRGTVQEHLSPRTPTQPEVSLGSAGTATVTPEQLHTLNPEDSDQLLLSSTSLRTGNASLRSPDTTTSMIGEQQPSSEVDATAEVERRAQLSPSAMQPVGAAAFGKASAPVVAGASTSEGSTVDEGTSKALATARAALEWYEKSVAARRMQTLGVLGTTAKATPPAVHLLKLQAQQRARSPGAVGATPTISATAATPTLSPIASQSARHPQLLASTATSDADMSGQLDAFEALTSPLSAALAADAYRDEDDDDGYEDDDSDIADAVELLKTRHRRPIPKGNSSQRPEAKLVDADAQTRAALSRGASAKALAMARKLDALSVEHADLTQELSAN